MNNQEYRIVVDADCGARFKQEHDLIKANTNLQLQALRSKKRVIDFIKRRIEESYRK